MYFKGNWRISGTKDRLKVRSCFAWCCRKKIPDKRKQTFQSASYPAVASENNAPSEHMVDYSTGQGRCQRGNYPVFEGYNHMQYQIRDPRGFAGMLRAVMEEDRLPELAFMRR